MCVSVIDSVSGVWPVSVSCCSSLLLSFHTSFLSLSLSLVTCTYLCFFSLPHNVSISLSLFLFPLPTLSLVSLLSHSLLSSQCSIGLCPPPPYYYIQNKYRKFIWKMLKLDSERWYERELYHTTLFNTNVHVYIKVLTSPVLCVPYLY